MSGKKTYCGLVTIVGRSNVGKSTLMCNLLGRYSSNTSRKMRCIHRSAIGIHTKGPYQAIYVDSPDLCIEKGREGWSNIKRLINTVGSHTVDQEGLVIFVVDSLNWLTEDAMLLNKLHESERPTILAVNKVDTVQTKTDLLPHLQWLDRQMHFFDIVPLSAKTGLNVGTLAYIVQGWLPSGRHLFSKERMPAIPDRSQHFIASAVIRETIVRFLGSEIAYSVSINIERFQSNKYGGYDINGLVLVKREGQKKMLIGKRGSKIKIIGMTARQRMQATFTGPIHLELWVKVKSNWVNDNEYKLKKFFFIYGGY